MDDEKARDFAENWGARLMTLDDALSELEDLHRSIIAGEARPAKLRAASRSEPLISALAMCEGVDELIDEIRDVRGFANPADKLRAAINAAGGKQSPSGENQDVWSALTIKVKSDGTTAGPESSLINAEAVFRLDPHWKGRIRMDLFSHDVLLDGKPMQDVDEIKACGWLDRHYRIQVPVSTACQALQWVAETHQVHPVREYLEGLEWDGTPRVDDWLSEYCGAPDKTIVRAYSRRWMISAVARVMRPGCKVDTTLIIQGAQGAKKSTAFEILSGSDWFSDTGVNLRDKDAMQVIRGVWVYEFAELDAVRRAEQTAVKAFLSSRVDRFRPSFGRNVIRSERQCVIVGTTNELGFLRDSTGSRRFWPVQAGRVDAEGLAEVKDQMWAEALAAFKDGEQWWLTEDEERRRVSSEYLFVEEDAWTEAIAAWLRKQPESTVSALEVWTNGLDKRPGDLTQSHRKRVLAVLGALGCTWKHTRTGNVYEVPSEFDDA